MFASKTPRDLNRDATPWEVDDDGGYTAYGSREDAIADGFTEVRWDPQPEFDHVQHNEPNLILSEFRELNKATGNDLRTDAYLYLSDLLDNWETHDLNRWNHAVDVLGKLIRVKNLAALESNG